MQHFSQLSAEIQATVLRHQRLELTEHLIYSRLALNPDHCINEEVLLRMADDEKRHYEQWKKLTGQEVKPFVWRLRFFAWTCRWLGLTFGLKWMEAGEKAAQGSYCHLSVILPDAEQIMKDEHEHEHHILGMIEEERLRYVGSVVLGLNDALVELTGVLAGLTLALGNTTLVAMTGSITGVAAALSMASSEYISTKNDKHADKHPVKASLYTGAAYLSTVVVLIMPFLIFSNIMVCMALSLVSALGVVAVFNYYIAVVNGESFRRRFLEMSCLSFGVAFLSFAAGYFLKFAFGVEVD